MADPVDDVADDPIIMDAAAEEDDGNMCCICHEDFVVDEAKSSSSSSNVYTLPECGHKFHINCILPWFRTGNSSCPYCRCSPHPLADDFLDMYTDRESLFKFKFNVGRRKNAPARLKTLVKRLMKHRARVALTRGQLKKWQKSARGLQHKKLSAERRKLRNKTWTNQRQERKLKSQITTYPVIPARVRPMRVRR